ncbi:PRC-barrel domain-containing protein [Mucilaginibacter sp.]|uniref:PRC-barrel domain-containing protein n=1 Tax=Mucilaginibacter sp. TaxID=1882438 RepID=UPI0035BBDC0E
MEPEENVNYYRHLEALGDSDFEIVDGQPDIQGWDIENSEKVKIGEVDDLLFDPETRKVRYIVLDTENNDLDLEDGHVLIPIGVAELHENNDTVMIPNVTAKQLASLPLYERGRGITADIEEEIRKVFTAPDNLAFAPKEDFYDHEHFNETKFYGKRKPIVAEDHLLTQGGNHLLTEGGNHLLTEGEDAQPPEDSAENQKYNRDNIIP